MSQVTRTTDELIVNSLYLLGELGVNETPDAFMLSTGLELINEILDKCAADSIYIPYETTLSFTMTAGQAAYTVSELPGANVVGNRIVDLTFANYFIDAISYPIRILNKAQYYGNVLQTTLNARPSQVFLNKQSTESILTFYPAPDQNYTCSVKVKGMLNQVIDHQNLSQLPPNYYGFLKYALARKFRSYYPSGNWNDTAESEYQDYYQTLKNTNETDLTIRPSVIFKSSQPFYWQIILAY